MKIRKTVKGKGLIEVSIETETGWNSFLDHLLSQELTGAICEGFYGVFCENRRGVQFYVGAYSREFIFENNFSFNYSVDKIAKILQGRINKVRKWVAECKADTCITTAEITLKH